jgi:2-phosphosulfolactate phosphatase
MKILTSLSPHQPLPASSVDVAVVMDVIRATTVMTQAIASGAKTITTTQQINEALALADSMSPRPLLCGERDCKRIDGFDLGNSPSEYRREIVGGRDLILTTTNGTQAIQRHAAARQMLAVSFLNLSVSVRQIAHANVVQLVCAGTNGQVSGEDVLLAGAICQQLVALGSPVELCDSSKIACAFWQSSQNSHSPSAGLLDRLMQSLGARNLLSKRLGADLNDCVRIDEVGVVVARIQRSPATFALSQ